MVSSRRSRRGTSLFSRKIHRYSSLPIYFDGFLRANANRRWLISERSLECEIRRAILLFIYLHFFPVFADRLFIQNYSFPDYKVSLSYIDGSLMNIATFFCLLDKNNFRVVEQTSTLNMKLTNYFLHR